MNQQINTFRVFRAGGHFDRLSAINTFPVQRPNIGQKLRYGSPRPNLEPFLEPVPRQNQKRIPREALISTGFESAREIKRGQNSVGSGVLGSEPSRKWFLGQDFLDFSKFITEKARTILGGQIVTMMQTAKPTKGYSPNRE